MNRREPPKSAATDFSAATIERLAEGQAALWLNESLMLALINTGVVEKDRMLEAIDLVIEAKRSTIGNGPEAAIRTASLALLASISTSIAAAQSSPADPADPVRPRSRTPPGPSRSR